MLLCQAGWDIPRGAKKGCGKAEGVGGIWEQIAWQPTTRVVSGTGSWAKGTGGMLVLLVLLQRSCLHQGGTNSAVFLQGAGQCVRAGPNSHLSRPAAGVFVLNLVCRDARLKESVLATLREVFPLLYTRRIEGEINEILFCQPSPEGQRDPTELGARARALEGDLRQPGRPWDSSYVLADMLQAVKIL